MLKAIEGYERQELKEWLEFDKRYPTLKAKLRANLEAAFPGITFKDEQS